MTEYGRVPPFARCAVCNGVSKTMEPVQHIPQSSGPGFDVYACGACRVHKGWTSLYQGKANGGEPGERTS